MNILETVVLLGSVLPSATAAEETSIFRTPPRITSFVSETRLRHYEGWSHLSRPGGLVRGLCGGGRPNTRFSTAASADGKEKKKMPYALRKLGYVKSRPKKYRTPRKHYRYKYAAQKIREKTSGGVREFKGKPEKYVGEYTGIKISSIRSRRHDTSGFFNPDPVEPTMRRFFLPRIHRDGNLEPHPYAKEYDTITKSSDEEGEEGGGSFDEEGIGAPIENSSNGPKSEKKWKIFNENDNIFNEQQPEEADVDDDGSVRGRLSKDKRGSSSKQLNSADEEEDVEEDTADGRKKRKLNAFQNGNKQESDETTLELST